MLVTDLLAQVPAETQADVKAAYNRHQTVIRNAIKECTRLSFQWDTGDHVLRCAAPVRVDNIGYPIALSYEEIPPGRELISRLAYWRVSLESLLNGGEQTITMVQQLRSLLEDQFRVQEAEDSISSSVGFARQLLAMIDQAEFDVISYILKVNPNILGVFEYDSREGGKRYKKSYSTKISLFWGVIGFVAHAKGWPVATLTAVVLTHELSHAYTHLGFDRDGARWTGEKFSRCDLDLAEGLAQYYTHQVLEKIEDKIPGVVTVFKALQQHQPSAYSIHDQWIPSVSPEVMGQALAIVRRTNIHTEKSFSTKLLEVKHSFKDTNLLDI
jgi:hypothetical protein